MFIALNLEIFFLAHTSNPGNLFLTRHFICHVPQDMSTLSCDSTLLVILVERGYICIGGYQVLGYTSLKF